jgi:hypothetical protein
MNFLRDGSSASSLSVRLSTLTASELRSLIERLANDGEAFSARIDYLTRPQSAVESIALRIRGIRRDDRFVDHSDLDEMVRVVRGVAEDIERDVLPREPVRALALTEQLMALNGPLMNRSLDDGTIGMAIEEACTLWLKIARVVRESGALPKMDWVARLKEVAGQDDCGVRRAMLQQAHLLFDEPQLRAMAESQERQAVAALATEPGDLGAPDDVPHDPRVQTLVLQDIAKALQDPQLYNRAVRLHHVNPDDRALEAMARFHLDCGDATGALDILESPWEGGRETVRLDLLDRAYGQLGDNASRIDVRRKRYQHLPCVWTYQALNELLDVPARQELRAQVSIDAVELRDVATAAQLLCAAGNWPLAQAILLARAKEFDVTLGTQLEPLAKEAEARRYPLMSVIIWRALLNPILERGASKAYYHAAQYLSELRRLAGTIDDHRGLPTHAEYEARLRERHGRKTGFWRQMSIRP